MTPEHYINYPAYLGLALMLLGATALIASCAIELMDVVRRRREQARRYDRLTDLMMARGFRVADKHGWIKQEKST
jgi:hypothetical protein